MKTLGMVTTTNQIQFRFIPEAIGQFLSPRVLNCLIAKFKDVEYEEREITQFNMKMHIAKLPFTEEQLRMITVGVAEKFCNHIEKQFEQQSIDYLIFSRHLRGNHVISKIKCKNNQLTVVGGQHLLIALLPEILKKICKIAVVDMTHMRIGIKEDCFSEKSLFIIKELAGAVKFITLVTEDIDNAKESMERIYEETGLAVWISNDIKNAFKEVQVILALDNFDKFLVKAPINHKSILFNLSSDRNAEKTIRNTIIDEVKFTLPINLKNILKDMGIDEERSIEHIILLKLMDIFEQPCTQYYNSMRKEFYNLGCKIKALKGLGRVINMCEFENLDEKANIY